MSYFFTLFWIATINQKKSLARAPLYPLRKKCSNAEYFWSAFSDIWTEYEDLQSKYPYSVWMRENWDQKNSESEHFFCSDLLRYCKAKRKKLIQFFYTFLEREWMSWMELVSKYLVQVHGCCSAVFTVDIKQINVNKGFSLS